jgi:hypothetical protein
MYQSAIYFLATLLLSATLTFADINEDINHDDRRIIQSTPYGWYVDHLLYSWEI